MLRQIEFMTTDMTSKEKILDISLQTNIKTNTLIRR
nr:MAG TPA: hypothetical protein [Caudoviricetes sp.]